MEAADDYLFNNVLYNKERVLNPGPGVCDHLVRSNYSNFGYWYSVSDCQTGDDDVKYVKYVNISHEKYVKIRQDNIWNIW